MKTMTDLEVLKEAYDGILMKWGQEFNYNEKFKDTHGYESIIAIYRMEKYQQKMDELHEIIWKMENQN